MPPATPSGTPKTARTQTSLFSFFSTPKKPAKKDSQDALLDDTAAMIDDAMLDEVAQAERAQNQTQGVKRKSQPVYRDDSDDEPSADDGPDDDDGDDDYAPDRAQPGRTIADSDDDEVLTDAVPSPPASDAGSEPPSPAPKRHRGSGSSAKRMAASSDGPALISMLSARRSKLPAASSDGSALMNMFSGGSALPTSPSLARTTTAMSSLSVASAKQQRAASFAKKNEQRYAWLEDVRDAQGVRPGEPGYDPRTLLVPRSAWQQFSPFERQYWEIKSTHWDTVVFFKKGQVSELYENDASIGHQEFDLKMTDRVNMRMAGVPEASFDHWVAQFLARGYKVARVDQLESKLAKDMRERAAGARKGDGLVARELTAVLTPATLVDPALLAHDLATYCLALVETTTSDGSASFGVAFVDAATAQFHLTTIEDDDVDRSALETLLVQLSPREVVHVRGPGDVCAADADGMAGLTPATWRVLKSACTATTDFVALAARREFWDAATTRSELEQADYFDGAAWPPALRRAADSPKPLALAAVGGLLSYLRSLRLDRGLASLANFADYAPTQAASSLVLDGPALSSLDVLAVAADRGAAAAATQQQQQAGTLFALVDHTRTAFGRRLLRRWTCYPLRDATAIDARLDVVDYLLAVPDAADALTDALAPLPDIERGLSRIHAGRCRVADFLGVLKGLDACTRMAATLQRTADETPAQPLPARIAALLAAFPAAELGAALADVHAAFDATPAAAEGRLVPHAGGDAPFDEVCAQLSELDAWLDAHLREMRTQLKCSGAVYRHMGKEPYQLEVPAATRVPSSFLRLSATKAVARYWSPALRDTVQRRAEALETRSLVLDGFQTRLYARFDRHYALAMRAVSVVAELDCLLALARASATLGAPSCRPTILRDAGAGYVEFRELRHPCVAPTAAGGFVANDVVLGSRTPDDGAASAILLTGPNMGGKSTLLRQLCCAVVLAQLGCHVPARSAVLRPVDRLFTRIGARDSLVAGRSTFMVEMAETAAILRHATPASLVVLDELGRGTSTHDGEAVAFAVLHALCARLGCLSIFSTHYGLLADAMHAHPRLRPMSMACAVDEARHRVTFLYRLVDGIAHKSHGMNVAAMAGVPLPIVHRAAAVAERFEAEVKGKKLLGQPEKPEQTPDAEPEPPLAALSDFANLLRMASLQSAANSDAAADANDPLAPVAGTQAARRANENQYWRCIVDHLRRSALPPTAANN
ncbi:DNA mismatch repair protein msh6 [Coemansia erecta]|uniref:DNA mismatch repair protein n=1 Tax=Coemansia erecta TaxID=147472 RepID=A0A9W7XVV3_9FUNG|nr:DNA mismatch repair protein msh6 [Coemansia erecta]